MHCRLIVHGGMSTQNTALSDFHILSLQSSNGARASCWSQVQLQGAAPRPRFGHSMTCAGEQLLILGGRDGASKRVWGGVTLVDVRSWCCQHSDGEPDSGASTAPRFISARRQQKRPREEPQPAAPLQVLSSSPAPRSSHATVLLPQGLTQKAIKAAAASTAIAAPSSRALPSPAPLHWCIQEGLAADMQHASARQSHGVSHALFLVLGGCDANFDPADTGPASGNAPHKMEAYLLHLWGKLQGPLSGNAQTPAAGASGAALLPAPLLRYSRSAPAAASTPSPVEQQHTKKKTPPRLTAAATHPSPSPSSAPRGARPLPQLPHKGQHMQRAARTPLNPVSGEVSSSPGPTPLHGSMNRASGRIAEGLSGEGVVLWPDDAASPHSLQQSPHVPSASSSRASSPALQRSYDSAPGSHGAPPPHTPASQAQGAPDKYSRVLAVSPPAPSHPHQLHAQGAVLPVALVSQRPHSEGSWDAGHSAAPFVSKLLQSQASLYARLSSTETTVLKGLADSASATAEQLGTLQRQQQELMQRLASLPNLGGGAQTDSSAAARIAVLEADFANCEQDRQALVARLATAEARAREAEASAARLQGQLQSLASTRQDMKRAEDTVQRQEVELVQLRAQLRTEQDLRQRQVREAMRALQGS